MGEFPPRPAANGCLMNINRARLFLLLAGFCSVLLLSADAPAPSKLDQLTAQVRNLDNFHFNPQTALADRVADAPDFLLRYLMGYDRRSDYSAYRPSEAEMKIIRNGLAQLPRLHREVLSERLVKVYFVSNMMSNGYTDWTLNRDGKIFVFMVFNPASLKSTISEVLTRREMSAFKKNLRDMSVAINAGNQPGFLYILLHESSHAVDYIRHITPMIEPGMEKVNKDLPSTTAFVRGTWQSYKQPEAGCDFPLRKEVTFYGLNHGPKISLSEAKTLYQGLEGSCFASLYGSQNWAEDFAEYFALYHLTQKMQEPYKISVLKNGKPVFVYEPMQNPKVISRFGLIEKFYAPK